MPDTHVCGGRLIHGDGMQSFGTPIDASDIGPKTLAELEAQQMLIPIADWPAFLAAQEAEAEAEPDPSGEAVSEPDPDPDNDDPDDLGRPLAWDDIKSLNFETVKERIRNAGELKTRSLKTGLRQQATFDEEQVNVLLTMIDKLA